MSAPISQHGLHSSLWCASRVVAVISSRRRRHTFYMIDDTRPRCSSHLISILAVSPLSSPRFISSCRQCDWHKYGQSRLGSQWGLTLICSFYYSSFRPVNSTAVVHTCFPPWPFSLNQLLWWMCAVDLTRRSSLRLSRFVGADRNKQVARGPNYYYKHLTVGAKWWQRWTLSRGGGWIVAWAIKYIISHGL